MGSIKYSNTVSSAITTLILFGGVAIDSQAQALQQLDQQPDLVQHQEVIQGLSFDRYTLVNDANQIEMKQVEVIHTFASELLGHVEDIPLEFSEAVDENFWDLI